MSRLLSTGTSRLITNQLSTGAPGPTTYVATHNFTATNDVISSLSITPDLDLYLRSWSCCLPAESAHLTILSPLSNYWNGAIVTLKPGASTRACLFTGGICDLEINAR